MKNKTKITGALIVLAYLILIGLLVFNVFALSDKYSAEEMDMIVEIERDIKQILDTKDLELIQKGFDESRERYNYDIVVTEGSEIIYKSVVYKLNDVLVNRTHPNAVAFESQGNYPDNTDYWVWYSIYKLNDSVFINSFLYTLVFISILSTLVMALTVFLLYRTLFNPLKLIEQSIELADKYQFDDISGEDDDVNRKFKRFTSNLQENISVVSRKHTDLERQLQSKRDLLNNTIVVSRSMVHDLKTPVHRNILENEIYGRDVDIPEVQEITERNQKLNREVMAEINTVLRMLKSEETLKDDSYQKLELVELITRSFKRFRVNSKEKGLHLNIDAPERVNIISDESSLTLLINNLLSNMVQYSKDNTELNIEIRETKKGVILTFINESEQEDIERMKKTEQLFNVVQNPEDGKHVYSSGNGLYLIENLVSILDGTYKLKTNKNIVTIEVWIPYE